MKVVELHCTGFRNLEETRLAFGPAVNVVTGRNGSGKSNLLEALHVLCLGRSQRGASDAVMLNRAADVYRLEGEVEVDGRARSQSLAYQKGGRKRVTIDGIGVRLSELYRELMVVSVGPEDTAILSGPPSGRRGLVDLYLSQLSERYLSNLTDYHRVLAQKNAALKNEVDFSAFDDLLVRHGAAIVKARVELVDDIASDTAGYYARISDGSELAVDYQPSAGIPSGERSLLEIENCFKERLESVRPREAAAQMALVGPHRDELGFTIDGRPARTHASQGEWRSAAVALKLSVYHLMRRRRATAPLLLLDEIFAELDPGRSGMLIELFADFEQLFITTASDPPPGLNSNAARFEVRAGQTERTH
jgi:DNA replication and repair protein RecF